MRRWISLLLLSIALAGCSTRTFVVAPEEVAKLNDSKWTVESEPAPR